MKAFLITLALLSFSFGFSQTDKEDLAIVRAVFNKEKKILVQEYMNFDAPNDAFWSLYDEYETKRGNLSMTRVQIISDYADQYNNLTDVQAEAIVKRIFSNDEGYHSLQKSYYKKMSKVIGAKNAAKFFQLEAYLQNIVRNKTMQSIPFIDELD
ncbi:hypothetical protein ACX0HA_01530 [Flavobacterium hauense]